MCTFSPCQLFSEENSLWQKRRDGSETEIIVNFFDRFHYSTSAKPLSGTDVDKSQRPLQEEE